MSAPSRLCPRVIPFGTATQRMPASFAALTPFAESSNAITWRG